MKVSAYSLLFVALVLGIAGVQSAPAQTFKRVKVKGGAALTQIASGGASVWARASNGHPYIYKKTQFVLANSISLSQIAVGGGNLVQADAVWGLDSSGRIYTATLSGTSWVFSQVPGVLSLIAVGAGYQDNCHPYEVWGLNPSAQIFRYNFCVQNWEQIPGTLGTLAVGGGDIWGINGVAEVYRFDFTNFSFEQVSGSLTQITVSGDEVWGLNGGTTYEFFLVCDSAFHEISNPGLRQIQAGGSGVWGIDPSGGVARYISNRVKFSKYQIPGGAVSISVGSGGGVWAISSSGQVYAFTAP
jgi:hypothetical protein